MSNTRLDDFIINNDLEFSYMYMKLIKFIKLLRKFDTILINSICFTLK